MRIRVWALLKCFAVALVLSAGSVVHATVVVDSVTWTHGGFSVTDLNAEGTDDWFWFVDAATDFRNDKSGGSGLGALGGVVTSIGGDDGSKLDMGGHDASWASGGTPNASGSSESGVGFRSLDNPGISEITIAITPQAISQVHTLTLYGASDNRTTGAGLTADLDGVDATGTVSFTQANNDTWKYVLEFTPDSLDEITFTVSHDKAGGDFISRLGVQGATLSHSIPEPLGIVLSSIAFMGLFFVGWRRKQ